ncbi:MAG: hypothetical protein WBA73_12525 [Devosia sp.]
MPAPKKPDARPALSPEEVRSGFARLIDLRQAEEIAASLEKARKTAEEISPSDPGKNNPGMAMANGVVSGRTDAGPAMGRHGLPRFSYLRRPRRRLFAMAHPHKGSRQVLPLGRDEMVGN